jgi:MFS family permease
MQILNQIIVADITNSRTRGLANGLVNLPFMVVPWIAAFIVDSALTTVGWRWGIGMFGFILPACSAAVIIPLALFQRRMKGLGSPPRPKLSVTGFLSHIDIVGVTLLASGFALVLLPLSLAGNAPSRWSTPWIPTLIAVGLVLLGTLLFYEARFAKWPVLPFRFLRNSSLLLAWLIGTTDSFAFSATHTYMYTWSVVVHDFSARNASFLTFTAGCMQVLSGAICGYLMYRTRRFKGLLLGGVMVRLIGYGIMLRLRGSNNSTAELFIVQLIQGLGSGIVLTIVLVVAQIVVSRADLAQSTALMLQFIYLGNALGSAVAGAIYTGLFRDRIAIHAPDLPSAQVDAVYNTIAGYEDVVSPEEVDAVNHAYSDVMRYMTLVALVASAIPVLCVWWLKDWKLSEDRHNLAEDVKKGDAGVISEDDGAFKRWWRTGKWW